MFRLVWVCALGMAGLAATQAVAQPQPLTGSAIRATLSGATIQLDTPLAATVPIHYLDNGQVTGEAGNLSWVLGAAKDNGRWWVEKDRVCHRWSVWFEAENQCLRLSLEGDRLFWLRDDGKTGTATLILRPQRLDESQTVASMMAVPVPVTLPPVTPVAPSLAKRGEVRGLTAPAFPRPATVSAPVQTNASSIAVKRKSAVPARSQIASAKRDVEAQQIRAATSSVAIVPTFMVAGVDEDDVLYVRDGPSSEHASVGALSPQAQGVTIIGGCQQEWCRVAHNGVKGWVNTYYLEAENPVMDAPLTQARASLRR